MISTVPHARNSTRTRVSDPVPTSLGWQMDRVDHSSATTGALGFSNDDHPGGHTSAIEATPTQCLEGIHA